MLQVDQIFMLTENTISLTTDELWGIYCVCLGENCIMKGGNSMYTFVWISLSWAPFCDSIQPFHKQFMSS